jgi:exosortase
MPVVGLSEPAPAPPAPAAAAEGGPPPRVFPTELPLREAIGMRWRALLDDLRVPQQFEPLAVVLGLAAALVYSYWPGLVHTSTAWNNAQYSHGWIVPLFTVAILFWWRQPVAPVSRSARIAGLALLAASLALRLIVARYRIITIDMYTFVPALAGVVLAGGGWSMFRWACVPVAFLIFMYPLPDEATRYILGPLQTLATIVSTFAIQTLGIDAIREGNQIVVGETHLGVVDACSGLRMLTIFIALAVAIVMLGEFAWYERLVILASSIPIALVVNAIRITLTGAMYTVNPELAEKIFHDWAGYFMMPLALAMLWMVQQLLAALFVEEEAAATVPLAPASGMLVGAGPRPPAAPIGLVPVTPPPSVAVGERGAAGAADPVPPDPGSPASVPFGRSRDAGG